MSVATVASMCASLGGHLEPLPGFSAPDVEVTAVHISELDDPTPYLSGGELLLTTGLMLPASKLGCRRYVARLAELGVSALAFGLGPVHQEVPSLLVETCHEVGLPLLVVPAPTPFLTITRAYWKAVSRSTERHLSDAVAAHRALVDAATGEEPAAAILHRLAGVTGGWTALLDETGEVVRTHPVAHGEEGDALRAEIARLQVAGVHSSASFTVAGQVAVVFPLAVRGRIVGYLAVVARQRLDQDQRRVVVTAAGLLSLTLLREKSQAPADEVSRRCVAVLLDLGLVEAAHRLAAEVGVALPAQQLRALAVRGRVDELAGVVERWCVEVLPVRVDESSAWFLLPAGAGSLERLGARLRELDPGVAAVVSEAVPASTVGEARARAQASLADIEDGTVVIPADRRDQVASALTGFLAEASLELTEALVAYLRHRGQWERTARALDLHRNTLRYRMARVRELLGLDLDDPDVAAELWLALRERGIA